jgi:hypothetical protein
MIKDLIIERAELARIKLAMFINEPFYKDVDEGIRRNHADLNRIYSMIEDDKRMMGSQILYAKQEVEKCNAEVVRLAITVNKLIECAESYTSAASVLTVALNRLKEQENA